MIDEMDDMDKKIMQADLERITQAGEAELAEADKARMDAEKATRLIAGWDANIPDDEDSLLRGGIQGLNLSAATLARTGLYFLKLKETHWRKKFVQKLADSDIPQRQVYNAMSVASAMLKLPPKSLQSIANFSGTQLIELAKLPEETLEEAFESGILNGEKMDDIARMSVREMQKKFREEREKHQRELIRKDNLLASKNKHIDLIAEENERLKGKFDGAAAEDKPGVQAIRVMQSEVGGSMSRMLMAVRVMDARAKSGKRTDRDEFYALNEAATCARNLMARIWETMSDVSRQFEGQIHIATLGDGE